MKHEDTFLFSDSFANANTNISFCTDSSLSLSPHNADIDSSSSTLDLPLTNPTLAKCSVTKTNPTMEFDNIYSLCQSFGEISFHMNALTNATEVIPSSVFAPLGNNRCPTPQQNKNTQSSSSTMQNDNMPTTTGHLQGGHSPSPDLSNINTTSSERLALSIESNVKEILSKKHSQEINVYSQSKK